MNARSLRVGMVGAGFVSQHHLMAWRTLVGQAQVVAIADPSDSAARNRAAAFAIPAIIILQPIMGEIARTAGIDPYHMGIVIVLTLSIGLITPPYGLCLLIAADLGKISTVRAMKALFPFYVISLVVVIIAAAFPELMLSVPKYLMPQFMR